MAIQELRFNTSWEEVKEKIKEANVHLTDEDLAYQPGKEDELLNRLQKKMNKSKEEIRKWIESVAANEGMAG